MIDRHEIGKNINFPILRIRHVKSLHKQLIFYWEKSCYRDSKSPPTIAMRYVGMGTFCRNWWTSLPLSDGWGSGSDLTALIRMVMSLGAVTCSKNSFWIFFFKKIDFFLKRIQYSTGIDMNFLTASLNLDKNFIDKLRIFSIH